MSQGEHVSCIAESYGFRDFQTIWNHPNNAELRGKRNPNVLFPGDILFIPELTPREEDRPTTQIHKFVVKRRPLKIRITLENQYGDTISTAPCLLTLDSDSTTLTSDGQGKLELTIPAGVKDSALMIQDAEQTSYANVEIPLKIGHLDPVTEVTGQQARLKCLGYFTGTVNGETEEEFQSAVEEFQCEHDLLVDGICGPQTQAKLKLVHGC